MNQQTSLHTQTRRILLTAVLTTLSLLTVAGCAGPQPSTGVDHAAPIEHVHGIVPDPSGNGFLIGTHGGIYTATDEGDLGPLVDGPTFDAMGLTVVDGDLLASGHPDDTTPAELGTPNLGIIRSTDTAETWMPVAFTGEKDFHILTSGPAGEVFGQATDSGQLLTSTDKGTTWTPTGATLLAFSLIVDANGRILASTPDGVQESTDNGASFTSSTGAPPILLLNVSPDHQRIVGVGNGTIWVTTAGSMAWAEAGTVHGSAQAIAITDTGDMLVIDDSGITHLPGTP